MSKEKSLSGALKFMGFWMGAIATFLMGVTGFLLTIATVMGFFTKDQYHYADTSWTMLVVRMAIAAVKVAGSLVAGYFLNGVFKYSGIDI